MCLQVGYAHSHSSQDTVQMLSKEGTLLAMRLDLRLPFAGEQQLWAPKAYYVASYQTLPEAHARSACQQTKQIRAFQGGFMHGLSVGKGLLSTDDGILGGGT